MSIRLNKAIRELNIGLQTAVEFLEKKQTLGEVKSDPNFSLNDEQYKALVDEFKTDKDVKNDAVKLSQKKQKEQASEKKIDHRAESLLNKEHQQQYKPLGKIDLESMGKKPTNQPSTSEPIIDKKEDEPKVQKEIKQEQPKPKATPKPKKQKEASVEVVPANSETAKEETPTPEIKETPQPVEEEKTITETQPTETEEPNTAVENEDSENKEREIFQTSNEKKILNVPKMTVVGKIDLSAINQNTRPKRKTKDEWRKERDEKIALKTASTQQEQGKKKRARINKERVDINTASGGQQQQQQGNKQGAKQTSGKKNKNRNVATNNNTKKVRNRNQRPLEVDDEAVARQVKETLARLTSKSQNKKGAKYRKEKRDAVQERLNAEAKAESRESKTLKLTEFVTVSELATMMNIPVTNVISTLMSVGIMVSINQRLDAETINLVTEEFE